MRFPYVLSPGFVAAVAFVLAASPLTGAKKASIPRKPPPLERAASPPAEALGGRLQQLPIVFEPQTGEAAFTGWGGGYRMHLESGRSTFVWAKGGRPAARRGAPVPNASELVEVERVTMNLEGSRAGIAPEGLEPTSGYSTYFHGNDRRNWRTRVPHYAKVRFRDVYAGIDVVYYGSQQRLEYDFVVKPGASPRDIRLAWDGARDLRVDPATGDLLFSAASGQVRHLRPHIYQYDGHRKVEVAGAYRLLNHRTVGFEVARYDKRKPLVIDPILLFASHLGGSMTDDAFGVTTDSSNNIYVCGRTMSLNFRRGLTSPAFQTEKRNPLATTEIGFDGFLVKLNPTGTSIIYATFLGGLGYEVVQAVSVDSSGNPYLAGETTSNLPVENAFPTTGAGAQTQPSGGPDGFVTKLDSTATSLEWSSYVGGPLTDALYGISVLGNNVIAVGKQEEDIFYVWWNSLNLGPINRAAYGGPELDFAYDVVTGPNNLWYVGGVACSPRLNIASFTNYSGACDGFYMRVNSEGVITNFHYVGSDAFDEVRSLAVTQAGEVYVTGETNSSQQGDNTYGINGFQGDVFIARYDSLGLQTHFGYFGGSLREFGDAIAVDALGAAWVGGFSQSSDFPDAPFSPAKQATGGYDAFLIRAAPTPNRGFNLLWSTYFGALVSEGITDVAVAANGSVFFVGTTGKNQAGATVLPPGIQPSLFTPNFGGGEFDSFIAQVASTRVNLTAERTYGPPSVGSSDPFRIFTTVSMTNAGALQAENCGISTRLTGGAGGCLNCAAVPAGQTVRRAFTTSPGPGGTCSPLTVKLGCETADMQSAANDATIMCPAILPSQCQPSPSTNAIQAPAEGGEQEFTVTIPSGCAWDVTRDQSFVEILSPVIAGENGLPSGARQVRVRIAANTTGALRSATLSIRSVGAADVRIDQPASASSVAITLSPSSVTLNPNGSAMFNATVTGAANTAVMYTLQPPLGAITSAGLYTAPSSIPSATTVQLTAASVADPARIATATILLQPASSINISIAPGAVTLQAGQTAAFSAIVTGSSNTGVTYAISPAIGAISPAGVYTAPASIASQATVQVTATSVADPTRFATATITLQPPATVSVSLTPSLVTLGPGHTVTFSPTVTGAANNAVTYSLIPSAGSITQAGVYTAPASIPQAFTVQVIAVSVADPTKAAVATVNLQPTVQPTGLSFAATTPCRIMETRPDYNFESRTGPFGPPFLAAGETRVLRLTQSNVCAIPASARAYVLNVTLIPRGPADFVTVWPGGESRPAFYTVRSPDGNIVANSAIVAAGPQSEIQIYTSGSADMVIDISGYFTGGSTPTSLAYYPLTPCRVIETRADYRTPPGPYGPPTFDARQTRRFRFPGNPYCAVPPGASAYSVTITVAPPGPLQFLAAWPAGGPQPNISNINSPGGRVLANNVILPASADGSVDIFAFDRTDVLVDITGYFAPDDGQNGLFYFPVRQCRAVDTQRETGPFGGPIFSGETTRSYPLPAAPCAGIPSSARAYSIHATAIPNGNPMPFVTAYATGQPRPNASILNAFQGQTVTNSAIVPAGTNGSIDLFPFRATHIVIDVAGYFGR